MNNTIAGMFMPLWVMGLCAFAPTQSLAANVARDPFHPGAIAACAEINATQHWQLKGVIGAGDHWIGWLAQSDDQWLKLKQGEMMPSGGWQVSQLDKTGMRLTAVTGAGRCDGSSTTVSLPSLFSEEHVAR